MLRKRLLLVDDEKGFTDLVSLNLESTGTYEVLVVNDAKKTISAALKFHPDLILLDVIMPAQEGPDVAFEIMHNPQLQDIPIVFLTATVTKEEVKSQGGRIGGHAFVAKPTPLAVLMNSIESNLSSIC